MSLSVFAKIPVPALKLENPLHYSDSAVSLAKVREPLLSGELKSRLHRHALDLKLDPKYIGNLNVHDFVAKVHDLGVSNHPTPGQNRQWLFASTLVLFIFEFDDHFDTAVRLTPENIARVSKDMRDVLRSLSRHNLCGLQGSLEDWPAKVPCKEAYHWLLREGEDLREGTAQLIHDTFVDYCYGTEGEVIEWQPDMYRGDFTAWNLDRYCEIRKRSIGVLFAVLGPLFIRYNWIQKEHITTCIDLLHEAAIVVALANDVAGMNRDLEDNEAIDITSLKIAATSSEVVQYHNKKVEVLHKKVLELECNTWRFMEQVEASVVGLFLWHLNAQRYAVNSEHYTL
nr:bicyclogermacrene synthase uBuTS-1 [Bubarida sp. uBuTS-1]